jgi:CRP-like cAMP-binding protein
MAESASIRNRVLAQLSAKDFGLLEPKLEPVDLPLRLVLEKRGKPIKAVYFPENGFASVVATSAKNRAIEVGVIGRDGMTGVAVVLGSDRADDETFIQAAGHGHRIQADHLRESAAKSSTLQSSLLRYVQTFLTQTKQTAVANGSSTIEARLARWLLMADDRIQGDELPLTHEFLAMMLATRRPGVTVAFQELEKAGLISRRRGRVVILDRESLEGMSKCTYTPVR